MTPKYGTLLSTVVLVCIVFLPTSFGEESLLIVHYSQLPNDAARDADPRTMHNVYTLSTSTLCIKLFWAAEGRPSLPKTSPKNGLIALSDLHDDPKNGVGLSAPLIILTPEGVVKGKLEDSVDDFAWSPQGDSLVYAVVLPDGDWEKRSDGGIWLLDLSSGAKRRIMDGGRGTELFWAPFDNCIYSTNICECTQQVRKYDPTTGVISETKLRSISFSPSGKLYWYSHFADCDDDGRSHLCSVADNSELMLDSPFLQSLHRFHCENWMDDDLAIVKTQGYRDVLFSCSTGTARQLGGNFIAALENGKVVLVGTDEGRLTKKNLSELPVVNDGRIDAKNIVKTDTETVPKTKEKS